MIKQNAKTQRYLLSAQAKKQVWRSEQAKLSVLEKFRILDELVESARMFKSGISRANQSSIAYGVE